MCAIIYDDFDVFQQRVRDLDPFLKFEALLRIRAINVHVLLTIAETQCNNTGSAYCR